MKTFQIGGTPPDGYGTRYHDHPKEGASGTLDHATAAYVGSLGSGSQVGQSPLHSLQYSRHKCTVSGCSDARMPTSQML